MPKPTKPPSKVIGNWTVGPHAGSSDKSVWHVTNPEGVAGVIKYCARPAPGRTPPYFYKRFRAEVEGMRTLARTPGVLPLLDADPHPTAPEWLVTEKAQLLAEHFGPSPDFRAVVESFRDLADTLATLYETGGAAHRDIKPDNLFWLKGNAVIGDFGIAAWPSRETLTLPAHKIGPLYYLAPEALEPEPDMNPYQSDVFSFAKSLWAVATNQKYPPQGILSIHRDRTTSLWEYGGQPAIELGRLLEMATTDLPLNRPTMRDMSRELSLWLGQHPVVDKPVPGKYAWPVLYESFENDSSELDRVGKALIRLLNPLRALHAGTTQASEGGGPNGDSHLDFSGGDPDWEPEWSQSRTLIWDDFPNVRVVALAFSRGGDEIDYLVEWQYRTADGSWQATHQTIHDRATFRLPSDREAHHRLATAMTALDPGSGMTLPVTTGDVTRALTYKERVGVRAHQAIDILFGPAQPS